MNVRNRVVEVKRVKASELRPHPLNWRTHPEEQQNAMRALLADIGNGSMPVVRKLPDGSLQLLDGHMRAELLGDMEIDVQVTDYDETEAAKFLATHDAITQVAGHNREAAAELLASVTFQSKEVADLLAKTTGKGILEYLESKTTEAPAVEMPPARYEVLVTCKDEAEQAELLEELTERGLSVKSLIG